MPVTLPAISWSPGGTVAIFAVAGLITVAGSIRLVALGDALADRTGWGEALFGVLFFGVATGLSGIVMTAVAAANDQPQLAYSNAVGGIAAQTTAVAVADAFYRRANLEHAAASLSNLLSGCLLVALLALALLGTFSPAVTVAGVHPASVAIVACYLGGVWLVRKAGAEPLWEAVNTAETRPDVREEHGHLEGRSAGWLWSRFALVGAFVAAGGWAIALAGQNLVKVTGLTASLVGGVLMGVVNALPEAVTALAAVRRGAVTLAVAAVLGGNILDAITLVVGDLAYPGGSIYHAAGSKELFVTTTGLLMTATLLGGLLVRQAGGWGRLGFEGVLLFGTYVLMVTVVAN